MQIQIFIDNFKSKLKEVDVLTWRGEFHEETVLHRLIEENRLNDFKSVLNENKLINRLLGESLINIPDDRGIYPVLLALRLPHGAPFVDSLIKENALLSIKDSEGKSCYHYQIMSGLENYLIPKVSPWILTQYKDKKMIIYVCEQFGNETISLCRSKLKDLGLNTVKVYYNNISEKPYTEDINFNLILGESEAASEYKFYCYL
jgi:hypothetical protein